VKKSIKWLILASIIVVTIVSCETYVDIEVQPIPQKPVLNCLFTENKAFKIKLSLSSQVNDTSTTLINNAQVLLYSNGVFIEKLQNKGKGLYLSLYKAQKGAMYTIKASIEGYQTIQASDSLPLMVPISDLYLKKKAIVNIYGGENPQVSFRMHDSLGVKNFYEIDLFEIHPTTYYMPDRTYTDTPMYKNSAIEHWLIDDPALSNEFIVGDNTTISFSDIVFDGKIYSLKLPLYTHGSIEYYLLYNVCSEKYYRYKSTIDKHVFNQGGFLYSELMIVDGGNPVEMYTNIENGYGIFAGYLSQEIRITDIRE